MRAAIFRNGEIVVDHLAEPKPNAGQVLVRTLACGICGSDLHARKHAHRMVEMTKFFPGRKPMDLSRDVVFGHERKVGDDEKRKKEIWAPHIVWGQKYVDITATEAMKAEAGGHKGRDQLREAVEFLTAALANGPVKQAEIKQDAAG